MKKILLMFSLFAFMVVGLQAQTTITGKLVDTDGMALIGASVVVQGQPEIGTITDFNGMYELEVPDDAEALEYSYTGFEEKVVQIEGRSEINITLNEGVTLDEAVVTSLGVSRDEKSLGYAVQELGGEEISEARETNFVNSLSGKISGVQVTGSSNLGGSSKILIRGNSSIIGDNNPLFVVDGVPIDNSNFSSTDQQRGGGGYDYGNAAQDINPNDIEKVSVLKGAAATALYGSRGANGVILITTKKGEKRDGIGVTVNSNFSMQQVAVLPDYQNQYGGGPGPSFDTLNGQLIPNYSYDGSWGPKFNGQEYRPYYSWYPGERFGETARWEASPDNVRDFFETGFTSNQNIAISGGTDQTTFRLSYTNLYQQGTQPNSELKRNTISLNAEHKLSDRISVNTSANYIRTDGLGRPLTGYGESVMSQFNQWFQRQLDMDELQNYKTSDGRHITWNPEDAPNGSLDPNYWDNPYWERYENYQDDTRDRIYGNIGLTYEMTDHIKVVGRAMTDLYTDERRSRYAVGGNRIPSFSEDIRRVNETNFDLILYYDNYFGDFSFNAFVGGNSRINKYQRNFAGTRDGLNVPGLYTVTNSKGDFEINDYTEEKVVNSAFANISLGYKNFLYLDITGRNDWSSTLPTENNSFFYPSVSSSFVFSEIMDSDVLSYGKLRLGWAQVGNDTDPYQTAFTYTPHSNYGSFPLFSVPNSFPNPTLVPEQTTSIEAGIDLRFWNNRLGFKATYYNSQTENLIFEVPQSGASGVTSQIRNAGLVENEGVELQLNGVIVDNNDFSWAVGVNFAKNNNVLKELYQDSESGVEVDAIELASLFGITLRAEVGEPLWTFYGTGYQKNEAGERLVDANGAYIPTDTLENLGTTLADFTGGVNTTVNYKNFSLYALVDFSIGGSLHSYTNQWGRYSGILEETVTDNQREEGIIVDGVYADGVVIDEVDVSGQQNQTTIAAINHHFLNGGYVIGEADQYDASFVKLREVRLSYTLPNRLFNNNFVNGASIGVYGRNLAILHRNVPHIDPEAGLSTGNIAGFEGGQLPTERSMGINLQLKF